MTLPLQCIEDIRDNKIEALDLSNRKITSDELRAVCDVLRRNTSVTKIYLCDNQLTTEDLKRLMATLKVQGRVEELRLKNVCLNIEALQHISKFIKSSPTIREMNLYGCKIDDTGVGLIARALIGHPSMKNIHLHGNAFGDTGAGALAEMLKNNWVLERVNLSGNAIGQRGAEDLLQSFSVNERVACLTVGGSKEKISEETMNAIEEACALNAARDIISAPSSGQKALKPDVVEELSSRFSPEKWENDIIGMKKAWNEVAKKDKPYLNFEAVLAETRRRKTSKSSKGRVKLHLNTKPKPPSKGS